MDFKKVNAPTTTVTYNRDKIDETTDNIYKAISIISKSVTIQLIEIFSYLVVISPIVNTSNEVLQ